MELSLVTAVRPLRSGNWKTLRSLRLAALTDSPQAFVGSLVIEGSWTPEQWRRTAGQAAWFGAFIEGVPAGLVSVVHDPHTGDHYAESMWVLPRFRGRGVVATIFGMIERYVVAEGGATLRLWVLAGNPVAVAAYERYGFRSTSVRQPAPGRPGVLEEEFILAVPSRPEEGRSQPTIRGTTSSVSVVGTGLVTERKISRSVP